MSAKPAATVGIKIIADDETGAAIGDLKKKLQGLQKEGGKAATHHGLGRRFASGFKKQSKDLARLGLESSKAGIGIKTLTAAGVTAGVIGITEHFMDMGFEAGKAADRIGMPVEALSRFQIASKLAGDSAEDATSGLDGLQQSIIQATHGQNNAALGAFRQFGIDIGDFAHGAKSASEVLPKIAEVTKKIAGTLGPEQAQHFLDVIGVGRGLYEVFRDGAEGLRAYTDRAAALGPITAEQVAKSRELHRAQVELGASFNNLGLELAGAFGPSLVAVTKTFEQYLLGHKDDVIGFFHEIEHGLEWLTQPKNMTWIGDHLDSFTGALKEFFGQVKEFEQSPIVRRLLGLPDLGIDRAQGPLAAPGAEPPPVFEDNRHWWERAYKSGPGLFDNSEPSRDITAPGYDHDTHDHPDQRSLPRRAIDRAGSVWRGVFGGDGTQGGEGQRNLRNNNPTNLSFAGQAGATSDGRFAVFKNLETGVAADLNQFLLYQDRDHLTSVQDMIHKATPGSENPGVESYIDRVAANLGVRRSDSVDLHDPGTAKRFILAVAPNEGGTPDAAAVERGVNLRLGAATAGAGTDQPPGLDSSQGGAIKLEIVHVNPPPGASLRVTQNVDPALLQVQPPQVRTPMMLPGSASPGANGG